MIIPDRSTGSPKPILIENIKAFLRQYHTIDNPDDVDAVVKAFQQAYPNVKIATLTLETALKELQKDKYIVNTIMADLLNNELAATTDGMYYSTDQLIQVIKQKYPMANDTVVNGVLTILAG